MAQNQLHMPASLQLGVNNHKSLLFVGVLKETGYSKRQYMNTKNDNLSSRCVVLVPLNRIDAAHHVIKTFDLNAFIEHSPSLAMAEICLLHQRLQSVQPWNGDSPIPHLILVHTSELSEIDKMVSSIRKYLPQVRISELRNGRIEEHGNQDSVVDALEEPPIVHSEPVDADELSMLLDNSPQEVDE
jgi:hypothetical protein